MSSLPPLATRDLLTIFDVAFRLNISVRTAWRWLSQGRLPQPIRYSRRLVRWRTRDLEFYVQALRQGEIE